MLVTVRALLVPFTYFTHPPPTSPPVIISLFSIVKSLLGRLGGAVIKRLPSAQGVIPAFWDRAPHRDPLLAESLLLPLPLPLLVFPLSLAISLSVK